ncbi:MAG: M28 family peptidase [Bacteroidetes bacterium]|nr:M28 family peptidase [Bacteroidota bacterium]
MAVLLLGSLIAYWLIVNPILATRKRNGAVGVSSPMLRKHVDYLCEVHPPRSYENTQSLKACASYIAEVLASYAYQVESQPYRDDNLLFENVIARYRPQEAQRVIVGAHYDVCGPYQGADDNASGVAGLLELARLVAHNKPELSFGIDFVAYCTEEPPYFRTDLMGSAIHADSLEKDERGQVMLMISLEMIGYYNERPNSQSYPLPILRWVYPTTANFIAVVGRMAERGPVRHFKKHMRQHCSMGVYSINTPLVFNGIDRSDHLNYWNRGMKAIMVTNTSFFRNHHYHTEGDTPDTLDFDRMEQVVGGVYKALVNLK